MSYFSRPTTHINSFSLEAWLDRLPCQLSPFHLTLFSRFLLVSQNGFGIELRFFCAIFCGHSTRNTSKPV